MIIIYNWFPSNLIWGVLNKLQTIYYRNTKVLGFTQQRMKEFCFKFLIRFRTGIRTWTIFPVGRKR